MSVLRKKKKGFISQQALIRAITYMQDSLTRQEGIRTDYIAIIWLVYQAVFFFIPNRNPRKAGVP